MIHLAVCDENEDFRTNVQRCWNSYLKKENIDCEIAEYKSGEELLNHSFPDVLLLNTNSKTIDGILVKEILYQMGANTRIIFISEHKNKMQDAFGKNVFAYLVKPLRREQLCEITMEMIRDLRRETEVFYYKEGAIYQKAYFKDIICVESRGRYTKIYLENASAEHIFKMPLRQWHMQLPQDRFLQCGRRWIVNRMYVTRISKEPGAKRAEAVLKNGMMIPLSEASEKLLISEGVQEMRKRGIMT